MSLFLVLRSARLLMVLLAGLWTGQQACASSFYVDCSQSTSGDGTREHPWNQIAMVNAQTFHPGDVISLRRDTVCHGSLSLHGSGSAEARIRLSAWSEGPRPRIVAASTDTQALLLKNAEYWQIDSLDIAGGNTYGVLVTGDRDQTLSHITLRNLMVHDVQGGELHNKDNGLVVFMRGSKQQRFDHVLIENVVAAHTNQWAGIMMGAGNFYSEEEGYNRDVTIRNSVVHDVYGDGIILFRVRSGAIDSSTAWLTGQQPTQNVGTPNAIWTWSCTDCTVRNSESFLTESPGVDGGAYDIDWATTRNTVENNYAHDTQGYCVAVFAAGYVTHDAVVRNNVCVNNGLSPRMARLQGAIYIHTWSDGKIDGMNLERNLIVWNPPVPAAPVVNDEGTMLEGDPITFRDNVVRSTSPLLLRSVGDRLVFSNNKYMYQGFDKPSWFWNGKDWDSLAGLQAAGAEKGSTMSSEPNRPGAGAGNSEENQSGIGKQTIEKRLFEKLLDLGGRPVAAEPAAQYRLVLPIDLQLDGDGLIVPEAMARLSVLRTLVREYNPRQLQVFVVVSTAGASPALRNALTDLHSSSIRFVRASAPSVPAALIDANGRIVSRWSNGSGSFNAATVGYAVRRQLGVPAFSQMDARP